VKEKGEEGGGSCGGYGPGKWRKGMMGKVVRGRRGLEEQEKKREREKRERRKGCRG
jgi:hypothetical protein